MNNNQPPIGQVPRSAISVFTTGTSPTQPVPQGEQIPGVTLPQQPRPQQVMPQAVAPVPPAPAQPSQELVFSQEDDEAVHQSEEETFSETTVFSADEVEDPDEDPRLTQVRSELKLLQKTSDSLKHPVFLGDLKEFKAEHEYVASRADADLSEEASKENDDAIGILRDLVDNNDSAQDHALSSAILRHRDSTKLSSNYERTIGSGIITARKPKYDENGNAIEYISGDDALRTMSYLSGGARRVDLLNSGIRVTLRSLTVRELNNHYNFITREFDEYGKKYGHFFFSYYDLLIKKDIIENLLPTVITDSNYSGWRNTRKLLDAISLQDYDVLLWAMGVSLYPNGYEIAYRCPHCHTTTTEKCDLSKLYLIDSSRINGKMLGHYRAHATKEITDSDLEQYRKDAGFEQNVTVEVDGKKWIFGMKQATLGGYLTAGEDFNNHLKTSIGTEEYTGQIDQFMIFNRIRCYLPWIRSVTCISPTRKKDANGNDIMTDDKLTTTEESAILAVLDNLRTSAPDLEKRFLKYIADTKLTIIAHYMDECPHCHAKTVQDTNGFIPFDAAKSFFTLSFRFLIKDRLKQTQMQYEDITTGTTVY